jgi:hypothetical protein
MHWHLAPREKEKYTKYISPERLKKKKPSPAGENDC